MLSVYKMTQEIYCAVYRARVVVGTHDQIINFLLHEIKVSEKELIRGFTDMLQNDNNVIDYGSNRNFIFSFNKRLVN